VTGLSARDGRIPASRADNPVIMCPHSSAELDSYPAAPEWDDEDGEQDAWELTRRR
jgi:hypothetical protein